MSVRASTIKTVGPKPVPLSVVVRWQLGEAVRHGVEPKALFAEMQALKVDPRIIRSADLFTNKVERGLKTEGDVNRKWSSLAFLDQCPEDPAYVAIRKAIGKHLGLNGKTKAIGWGQLVELSKSE